MIERINIYPYFQLILVLIVFGLLSCTKNEKQDSGNVFVPDFEKYTLGQYLFYDRELSYDQSLACSTCHNPDIAFTDGYKQSFNSKASLLKWNTPTVLNLQAFSFFSWIDTSFTDFAKQMDSPLFGQHPIELGLQLDSANIFKKLTKKYQRNINLEILKQEVSDYLMNLNSRNSKYDLFLKDTTIVLLEKERNGRDLFFGKYQCYKCHGGEDFNKPLSGNSYAYFKVTDDNRGLYDLTKNDEDKYKFRIPQLRNLALTKPYLHDGSVSKLSEVLAYHFTDKNQQKEDRFSQEALSESDALEIIYFLNTLNDSSYLKKKYFQNPFYENDHFSNY